MEELIEAFSELLKESINIYCGSASHHNIPWEKYFEKEICLIKKYKNAELF